jgi:hypothetical protein
MALLLYYNKREDFRISEFGALWRMRMGNGHCPHGRSPPIIRSEDRLDKSRVTREQSVLAPRTRLQLAVSSFIQKSLGVNNDK